MWNGTAEILNSSPIEVVAIIRNTQGPRDRARRSPRDIAQLGRARDSVHDRKTVGQESAGEGAEDQVLIAASFDRLSRQESDHDVEAQRHQLESDEQRDQIRTRGQEKHAALREKDQSVILAVLLALNVQILVRHYDNDERRKQKDPVKEQRKNHPG